MGRNRGVDYDVCQEVWFSNSDLFVNLPAVQENITNLTSRRGKDKISQIASLLRAVTCLDLTTLCGDDTPSNVQRLCHKAANPINEEILISLGINPAEISCGAVCVYPSKVSQCVETLKSLESSVPVAAVAAGFPSGQYPLQTRLDEIKYCVELGAKEIDIVISRDLVLCGEWKKLYEEVNRMRVCLEDAKLKTIIAAGELGSLTNVYKASLICMCAGADFIKTSTGKETVNATLSIGTVMARAIQDYYYESNFKVGFKPAGGIRTSKDVLLWQELMAKELDKEWLYPDLFRIGASSLLGDIEQNITQYVTGNFGKACLPFL